MTLKIKKYIPLLVICVTYLILWLTGATSKINFSTFQKNYTIFESYVNTHFFGSIIVYLGVYVLFTSLALPGATAMTLVGGVLFGQWLGSFLSVISITTGATIFFLSTRMAAENSLVSKVGTWLNKIENEFKKSGILYVISLRLIPVLPFFVTNIITILMQISLYTFIIGTFLGSIPITLIYTSLGVGISEVIHSTEISSELLKNPKIVLALTGLSVLAIVPIIYQYMFQKKRVIATVCNTSSTNNDTIIDNTTNNIKEVEYIDDKVDSNDKFQNFKK